MTRSDDERLADILEATDQIASLVSRGHTVFESDIAVQLAIERLLEIIGESANRLSGSARDRYPNAAWRDITRLRILLAHQYHRVDRNQVWQIAIDEAPNLARILRGAA